MAITFESVKDPYGLGAAGNAIGGAFMQRAMMDRQLQQQRDEQERLRNQQIQNSQTLGTTLKDFLPAEGQQWNQDRIASFMASALESGASMSDILNSIKGLQAGQAKPGQQSVFAKELAKKNVALLSEYTKGGRKAQDMLGMIDSVKEAINDPERFDNFISRSAAAIPGAEAFYGASNQVLNNFSKEFITGFTDLKGLRLTDAKLRWLRGITPSPEKTKEANNVALSNITRLLQIQEAYGDIARNLSEGYLQAGLDVPPNFESLVEDAVKPLREEFDNMYKMSTQNEQQSSLEVGSTFDKMPDPKKYEGAEITDKNGNKFVSNGTKWSKVK